jgi:hypothetical protein
VFTTRFLAGEEGGELVLATLGKARGYVDARTDAIAASITYLLAASRSVPRGDA